MHVSFVIIGLFRCEKLFLSPLAPGLPDDRGRCYVAHPRGGWGGRGHCGCRRHCGCRGFNRRPGKRGGDGDDGDGGYGSGILRICEPSKRLVLQWCLLDMFRYVYKSIITHTHTHKCIYIYIHTYTVIQVMNLHDTYVISSVDLAWSSM